jgi:hypothetical protein
MSKSVRAKMKCHTIEHFEHGSKVRLGAVFGTNGENKDFAEATPSGEVWMQISKGRPAAEMFEPGKEYYVDFTPVQVTE